METVHSPRTGVASVCAVLGEELGVRGAGPLISSSPQGAGPPLGDAGYLKGSRPHRAAQQQLPVSAA